MVPACAQDGPQVARQPLAEPRIEGGQRLVEQQQPRLDRQRPSQRDPLALATGEGRGQPVAVPLETHQRQQLVDPGRLVRSPPDAERIADVAAPH